MFLDQMSLHSSILIIFLAGPRSALQVLGFLGGEHELAHHMDVLIDELFKALSTEYETHTDGVRVRFVFKILGADNKAMSCMLKHRLGMKLILVVFFFFVPCSHPLTACVAVLEQAARRTAIFFRLRTWTRREEFRSFTSRRFSSRRM